MRRTLAILIAPLVLAACLPGLRVGGRADFASAGFVTDSSAPTERETSFSVAEHAPIGVAALENLEGGIWVLFTRPVVSLAKLEPPAASSPVLEISPKADGLFRWYGSRLLAFEPKTPLAPATEYTLTIASDLTALDGTPLSGDRVFRFRTDPLDLVAAQPAGDDVPPEACREIVLTFSYPVDLKTIAPSIRLEAAGSPVDVAVARPTIRDSHDLAPYDDIERFVALKPSAELPRDAPIVVRIRKGARARPENYGTEQELTATFHTLRPLELKDWNLWQLPDAMLEFSHPIREESVADNLRVNVEGYDVAGNVTVAGNAVWLDDIPVPFDSSFTVEVLPDIEDAYGQRLGAARSVVFNVGPAPAYAAFSATGERLLERAFSPTVALELQNVQSASYRVQALGWPERPAAGKPDRMIDLSKVPANTRHFELFDLSPLMEPGGGGAAWLSWEVTGKFWGGSKARTIARDLLVQVTDIGATFALAWNRLYLRAASLATGAPLADAEVALTRRGSATVLASGRTRDDGTASLELAPGLLAGLADQQDQLELVVRAGDDRLVLRPADMPSSTWNTPLAFTAEQPQPVVHLYSDRGIYRPGETLSFAGTARSLATGSYAPVSGRWRVELSAGGSGGTPVASAEGTFSANGTFAGRLVLPQSLEPDDYHLSLRQPARSGRGWGDPSAWAAVKIAFFRRVAFSVSLAMAAERAFIGDALSASFSGAYLAGGDVTRGTWSWWWSRRETWYQPPGDALRDFRFGHVEQPWAEDLGTAEGELAGDGKVTATQKLADPASGRVYEYQVSATIQDVDRQAISRQGSALVFASELLIGGKLSSSAKGDDALYFVTKGKTFSLQVVGVDPDGRPYPPADVTVRLVREQWKPITEKAVGGRAYTHWERELTVEKTVTTRTAAEPVSVSLATEHSGSYLVELEGRDRAGRAAYTRFDFYATGSDAVAWQRWDERQIEIVADRARYRPGDRARLLVKSPVAKGTFVVTVEREGVLETRTVELAGGTPIVEVDVTDAHVPVFYVFVATASARTAPPPSGPDLPDFGLPAGASGLVEIPVDTGSRRIDLAIRSAKAAYLPGTDASLTVTATRDGRPVAGAEIALIAADRGVLDLVDYHVDDPVDWFYARWRFPDRVAHFESRDLLVTPVTWKTSGIPGGDEKGEAASAPGGAEQSYLERRDFNPTALFRTGLVTGKDGTVTVTFRLPDQLTRFRTTAVASKGELFGLAEDELLVQNPLNVRAALPRRMRTGDRATAGVVITSVDRDPHAVAVSVASDLLSVSGAARRTVTLKAGETVEVAFDLTAPAPGSATLTFTVDSDVLKEKLVERLEVGESRVFESFAVIGRTTDRTEEALVVPSRFAGAPAEGLELALDSTIASGLAGAVRFLEGYPYDCLEQRTSRLFAWVLFPELAADQGIGPDRIAAELAALARYANADGGFSYWDRPAPRASDYAVTLRVVHLLLEARDRSIAMPAAIDLAAALQWLSRRYDRPYPWSDEFFYLKSYAVYLFARAGMQERVRAEALLRQGDRIGIFGYGFLGLAFQVLGDTQRANGVLDRLKNSLRVGTRSVTLVGTVHEATWYGGALQAKALLLMLYARLAPESQLVQALANDLLEHDRTGYFDNTSSAGWVLQAFSELAAGDRASDFGARVSLGATTLVEHRFQGLSPQPVRSTVPAAKLTGIASREAGAALPGGRQVPLSFTVAGTGTLYYTALFRYAVEAAAVEPRDEGVGVAADVFDADGKPVSGSDLVLGKVYRMKITVYSARDRTFLAVRAPLPSGAEAIDGSLATTQMVQPASPPEQDADAWWWPGSSMKIYDDEVRFHFDEFARGKQVVSFAFRTTTPGTFPTPPVQAELMYQPEVFGRTAGTTWRIAKP